MRPITVIRAVQFASIVVTAWSSAMPWGLELGIGKGPPAQFERQLVGAALLLLVGAVAMVMTARKEEKPGRLALAVSAAASLGALALALTVRSTAIATNVGHALLGGGWMWMAAGASMSLGATASAMALTFSNPVETTVKSQEGPARKPTPKSSPTTKSATAKRKRKKR